MKTSIQMVLAVVFFSVSSVIAEEVKPPSTEETALARDGEQCLPNQGCSQKKQDGLTPMKKPEGITEDMLTKDEKDVYQKLSPLYKKIYLSVLNRRQREQVAVFARRGQNPFDAINRILTNDRKAYDHSSPEDHMSPAESATRRTQEGRRTYY